MHQKASHRDIRWVEKGKPGQEGMLVIELKGMLD